jgi:ABC-type nitrate/sulfonate/bicarbonate transport system permease component
MADVHALPQRGMDAVGRSGLRDIPFRGGGFVVKSHKGVGVIGFVVLLTLWEVSVRAGWISPIFLPSVSDVLKALWSMAVSGDLWLHLRASLMRFSVGWALGTSAGVLVGFCIGVWSLARGIGLPLVSALFPVPKIALLPLFILWLGIGEPSKIATIALGCFFTTVIATFSAIDAVPRNLIRMGQSFNVPPHAVLTKVVLPGALPGILACFRITTSICLIILVSAEMIGAQYGIGSLIILAGNLMQTDQLLAGVVVLSMVGLLVGYTLTYLERWLLRWR